MVNMHGTDSIKPYAIHDYKKEIIDCFFLIPVNTRMIHASVLIAMNKRALVSNVNKLVIAIS